MLSCRHLKHTTTTTIRNKTGILIAIEGIDGAGKSTQAANLARLLAHAEEPDAFIQDRRQHLAETTCPALADGTVVVLDRYYYSTLA